MEYLWETPEEINRELSKRFRMIRRRKGITQESLAGISGVSYGSIKRFESTGQISLLSLTRLTVALGIADEIKGLFRNVGYASIEEVVNESR